MAWIRLSVWARMGAHGTVQKVWISSTCSAQGETNKKQPKQQQQVKQRLFDIQQIGSLSVELKLKRKKMYTWINACTHIRYTERASGYDETIQWGEWRTFERDASIMFELLFFLPTPNEHSQFSFSILTCFFFSSQTTSNYETNSSAKRKENSLKCTLPLICDFKKILFLQWGKKINGNR